MKRVHSLKAAVHNTVVGLPQGLTKLIWEIVRSLIPLIFLLKNRIILTPQAPKKTVMWLEKRPSIAFRAYEPKRLGTSALKDQFDQTPNSQKLQAII